MAPGRTGCFLLDFLVLVKNLVIGAFVVIWGLYGDLGPCPLGEGKSTEVEVMRWNFGSEANRQYEKDLGYEKEIRPGWHKQLLRAILNINGKGKFTFTFNLNFI